MTLLPLCSTIIIYRAEVIATTSSFRNPERLEFFRHVFETHGGKGSSLTVVPFNQASRQDCTSLMDWIYNKKKLDLDIVVPFAAISENGRDIGNIDDRSELAHRLMLTNLTRLLGSIKSAKEEREVVTRPAMVLLPLSPNHGLFGNDGLYAESKLG